MSTGSESKGGGYTFVELKLRSSLCRGMFIRPEICRRSKYGGQIWHVTYKRQLQNNVKSPT